MQKQHFHTLDGLRGVAALAVVLFHLSLWTETRWYFAHGYLAVDFFFCLSGFIIAYVYKRRMDNGLLVKDFLIQRLIRLYPIIFIGMVLGLCFFLTISLIIKGLPFRPVDVVSAFLLNVTLIPFVGFESIFGNSLYPLNHPFWSIFFEIVVNIAWVMLLRRIPVFLLFACGIVLALVFFPLLGSVNVGAGSYEVFGGLLRVYVGFTGGLFVYDLYNRGYRLPNISPWLLLLTIAALFMMPQFNSLWFDIGCLLIIFPALTLAGAGAAEDAKSAKIMNWLGAISYPLYGVHRPICAFVIAVLAKLPLGSHAALTTYILGMAASLITAQIVARYIDDPTRAFLTSRYKRARTRQVKVLGSA